MLKKIIYVDNAATTSLSKNALDAMLPFYKEHFGNPSSLYSIGFEAKKAMEKARKDIAECIGAQHPQEIYFTSGGSESDNWFKKRQKSYYYI